MWNNECEGIVTLFIFYSPKNHPMFNFNMDVGLSIQSDDPTHPKILTRKPADPIKSPVGSGSFVPKTNSGGSVSVFLPKPEKTRFYLCTKNFKQKNSRIR